ncbi:hypothetical protein ACX0G9_03975 [Flavitalea flava]
MKYPLTILLILLIGLQTFSKWCVILDYQVNREYIAKNLCINRAKPSCCCHGKCYLNKKMSTDETQQQTPGKGGQKEESPLQLFTLQNNLPDKSGQTIIVINRTRYLASVSREVPISVFHPPQA